MELAIENHRSIREHQAIAIGQNLYYQEHGCKPKENYCATREISHQRQKRICQIKRQFPATNQQGLSAEAGAFKITAEEAANEKVSGVQRDRD